MSSKPLRYAWNTNGCANHRLYDAIELVADAGYDGLALTLDWHHLDPFASDWQQQTERLRTTLDDKKLGSVIETGARFLLNPKVKHEPTLINPEKAGRQHRVEFLKRAVDIAATLGSEAVSFWAGVRQSAVSSEQANQWLSEGIGELLDYAMAKQVTLAVEPEPGMQIETIADLERIRASLPAAVRDALTLALDVGHVWVTGEMDPAEAVRTYGKTCGTAAIEGMNRGVHEHLPVTQGDMDVAGLIRSFQQVGFDKLICVELSRDSHRAHQAIGETIEVLKKIEKGQ
ncbi:MAG: sugar phosphate isomerase/epimerase family protein [Tunicatimonas sp.]